MLHQKKRKKEKLAVKKAIIIDSQSGLFRVQCNIHFPAIKQNWSRLVYLKDERYKHIA